MTASRTALVTGANQGLGRALVEALAAGLGPTDRVLLTGRDPDRVRAAAAAVADGPATARVEGRVLDVRDADAIAALAAELGAVDIVFSNATRACARRPTRPTRSTPWPRPATSRRRDAACLRPAPAPGRPAHRRGQRLGTLDKLDERVAGRFAAAATESLDAVDALVADWRAAVHAGRAEAEGYGTWLNIPSKVAQVAAVRAVARERRDDDLADGRLLMALCPGLIDTDASRPWFEDMSTAQTPAQAAAWPVELALAPTFDPAFYGELVQFGKVLPWASGIPVAHRAA